MTSSLVVAPCWSDGFFAGVGATFDSAAMDAERGKWVQRRQVRETEISTYDIAPSSVAKRSADATSRHQQRMIRGNKSLISSNFMDWHGLQLISLQGQHHGVLARIE